ncbi:MAG TPA: hypothetical protein PLO33_07770 [Kouleothrix sp.]|uniref:hypothetical protein n=1 Tax=Kouleothrix sp. TaxID=2779161 RepID=UPI002CCDFF84|nr:hypothetical protein [Kouleothrix sp.]HRC75560.1 hypothetical protein [Kouleothrix sp.]
MARFDLKTFVLIFGAALLGAGWAIVNRGAAPDLGIDERLRAQTWVIFATPFATFWGWFFARRGERLWAAGVCFCIYFFAPFLAARYESCAVVWGQHGPLGCFTATAEARDLANSAKHAIYFQAVVVVHIAAALGLALQRALSRSTIPTPSIQEPGVRLP